MEKQKNLSLGGKRKLVTGNGKCMTITKIGKTTIPSSYNKAILLKNVLIISQFAKIIKLISVAKLTLDNDVTMEFNGPSCILNDNH